MTQALWRGLSQDDTMRFSGAELRVYWGKVIGTLAGLATMKPVFALVGLALGHQFDRGFMARERSATDEMLRASRLPQGYLQILFETMGHVAKADGRVSESEIHAARSVMHKLGLKPALVRSAINWFAEGKARGYPLDSKLDELKKRYARRDSLRRLFVRLLLEVSISKSPVSSRERALIWRACERLDVGRVELAQMEATLRAGTGQQSASNGERSSDAREAYETLGLSPGASNDEVKTAYRRLMNRYHPDKVGANTTDQRELDEALGKTREIRAAFETLKALRSMR